MPQRTSPASSESNASTGTRALEFVATPNPNALKCVLSAQEPTPAPHNDAGVSRSYREVSETGNDPLARALFSIEGVTSVLISNRWFTINKRPDAGWEGIRAGVERVVREQRLTSKGG